MKRILVLLAALVAAFPVYSQTLATNVADANYTVLDSDRNIEYTSITAARTVTLPTASSNNGRELVIKDRSGSVTSTNTITISGTVDGVSNPTILAPYGYIRVRSNGTNWNSIGSLGTSLKVPTDGVFFVPPSACFAAVSGTAGTGNNTLILDGSVPALKASSTNAGASTATFTCTFQMPPSRLAAGRGAIITDITYLYSVQTTTATSMSASTFQSFTAPAAGTSETASSATLVTTGGTITQTPVVGSANLTAVSAGQYYSEKLAFGTPVNVTTDLQTFVLTFAIAQSASAAQIVTCPGFWVHYQLPNLL